MADENSRGRPVIGIGACLTGRAVRYDGYGIGADQQGIFAAALGRADPLMPLEDDGRLNDPGLRESFVTRAYAYHDWKLLCADGVSAHQLIEFYSRYKYLVMAPHSPSYQKLGRMLADAGKQPLAALAADFIAEFMTALSQRATLRSHTNVLFHLAGYLKRTVASAQRRRLADLIEQYRLGHAPLVVPLTMLRHHFANHPNAYIDRQVFMAPYPDELKLRNRI